MKEYILNYLRMGVPLKLIRKQFGELKNLIPLCIIGKRNQTERSGFVGVNHEEKTIKDIEKYLHNIDFIYSY